MRTTMSLLGIVMLAGPALAGNISITTTQRSTLANGTLRVELSVGNTGDEAAHEVAAVLRFGDASIRGERRETLAPGATVSETLVLEVGDIGPGRWPFAIAVDYTDANQYPFQALQMASITVGNPPPAKVAVPTMVAGALAEDGTIAVTLKNLSGDARTVGVILHVPDGLEVRERARRELALGPWEERSMEIPIVNRTALPGSRYPVFAAVEYELDDVHYSVVAQGVVEITSARNFVERHGRMLRIVAIAFGVVFVLLVAWRLVRS